MLTAEETAKFIDGAQDRAKARMERWLADPMIMKALGRNQRSPSEMPPGSA